MLVVLVGMCCAYRWTQNEGKTMKIKSIRLSLLQSFSVFSSYNCFYSVTFGHYIKNNA